jgi:membrane-associated phospholipid phosphatase
MSRSIRTLCVSSAVTVWISLSATVALAQQGTSSPIASSPDAAITTPAKSSSLDTKPSAFGSDLFKDTLSDFRRLSSPQTVTWLAIGTAAAGFSAPIDRRVTAHLAGAPAAQSLRSGNIIGGKEFQFGSALATYTLGRLTNNQRVTQVGSRLFRAQLVAQTVTGVIKHAAQRTRPDGTNLSFPSGHTSVSFASATVLQDEFGWKVGIPAYLVAGYVAAARIEARRHFLSDVAFGAAVGVLAGRSVTIGSGDKRFAVSPMASPGGAGVNFTWVGNER